MPRLTGFCPWLPQSPGMQLQRDPNYALAYAGVSDCYRTLPIASDELAGPAFSKAREAALRALEIDERLAEAHASLGYINFFYDWDWAASEKESKRALELNPNYALAHLGYAHLLSNLGRHEEAQVEVNRSLALDPLSPFVASMKGMFLYEARRYQESVEYLQKELEVEPDFWISQINLGKAYERQGRYQEALAAFEEAKKASGGTTEAESLTGYTYAVSGHRKEAEQALQELRTLSRKKYVPPYNVALVYLGLGNSDETLKWLEKAYTERDPHMVFLGVDPKWDVLRSDPRFINLINRLRFPQLNGSLWSKTADQFKFHSDRSKAFLTLCGSCRSQHPYSEAG